MREYFPIRDWYYNNAVGYLGNIIEDVFYDPPILCMVCDQWRWPLYEYKNSLLDQVSIYMGRANSLMLA
jgi:hypothetical protein